MKKDWILFCFLISIFFSASDSAVQAAPSVLLSEVLIGDAKASDSHEFIELYNPGASSLDISHYRLRYRNSKGTENSLAVIKSGSCIPAHGYFLWANSKGNYAQLSDIATATTLTENYSVLLYPPEGDTPLDTVGWGTSGTYPTPVLESLMRDPVDLSWLPTLQTPSPTKSTPCPEENPEPVPAPTPSPVTVRLNEILPSPAGDDNEGEYIELYNMDSDEADLSGFVLRDKTGEYVFPYNTILKGKSYFVLRRSVSKLSLNTSNETLSFFDANKVLVDSVQYDTSKEGVSLNYTGNGWRGSRFLTPGAENIFNSLPETKEKVPKKGYKGIAVTFDAKGKDADGDTLKYTWDFGDGHKSYKAKTTHKYQENGTYPVTLKTSDGSEDAIESFSIKIESFPKIKVRMTALVPNPSGKDSDNEWIELENRGKKSVNLKGFGIATGWKKLTNHPIREDFILEPKQKAKLTRAFSLFTLPNQKGKVELRTPDGDVLQKIKYKLDTSIQEDVVYGKEKGKPWEWQADIPKEEEISDKDPVEIAEKIIGEEIKEPEAEATEENRIIDSHSSQKAFQDLLNYGTNVSLPSSITLAFKESGIESEFDIPNMLEEDTSDGIFQKINSYLNAWQNEE